MIKISNKAAEPTTDPSLSETGSEQVSVQLPDLRHYKFEELHTQLEQIVDPACPLRDIHKKHVKELLKSKDAQRDTYWLATMTFFVYY